MKITISTLGNILSLGSIAVIVGAVLYLFSPVPAAWVMIVGGLLMILSFLLKAIYHKADGTRVRRLERMGMLGGLHYLIAGGFMLQGSTMWILLFAVATVFFLYSVLVTPRASESDKAEK